jgi:predicted ATPase
MSNLPVRPTRMIGREAEVARVRGLLAEARLVTVTAVGGSGKTRLAIAVGEAELPHCPSGVWFVDLTAVNSGAEVPGAIANGLGLNLMSGDATAQILAFLADKQALVILDNCEHVIDEAASFVEAFLATSNPTRILATSREAFDIDGERTVVLGSLPTDAADSPGVRLFVDRATAVEPSFGLTDSNLSTVSAICGRLDGMPLAIELAAARVTVMSPDELLAGLDDRFQLLSGGRRRSRQRTLEATLDWSYDLLDAEEQRVFRALGVFVDGFDLDAVAAVTGLDRRAATQHVETLRAKSLVVRADKRKATRFRLLETVKAYAEDRLVDAGEAEHVRDRHLAHFHSLAMAEGLKVVGSLDVGLRLREDCSNITTAFDWAADHGRWILAGELVTASQCAYHLNGRDVDAARALVRTTAHTAELDPDLHGCLLAQILYSGMLLADFAMLSAVSGLRRSPMSEFRSIGWVLTGFVSAWVEPGSASGALDRAEVELRTPSPSGLLRSDAAVLARSFPLIARRVDAFFDGGFEDARSLSQELLQSFARTTFFMELLLGQSLADVLLGRPQVAIAALAQLDDLDLPFNDGNDVRALAHLALGDHDAAESAARRFVARAAAGVLPAESNDGMLVLAAFARHEGDDGAARSFLLSTGAGRMPSTRGLARYLASQLGIAKEWEADVATLYKPDNPHGPMGATRSLHALRAELARRGWH